jgi:hypothetical protein
VITFSRRASASSRWPPPACRTQGCHAAKDAASVAFRNSTPAQALRRKEWTLLLRDPWLMSQTLMQLLYLLPAGFLLWRNFYAGGALRRCWCRS